MHCSSSVRSSASTTTRASDQVRCRGCDLLLAEQKFDCGDLAALRKNGLASTGASSRAVCLGCAPTMPRNRRDASVTLRCSTCMKDLPLKTFNADRVREWRRSDALRFAKCMACDPIKSAGSMHTCNKCKENLPLGAFGAQMQKLHGTQKWRCDHCQRPACTECGARPTKPLSYNVSISEYRCQTCLYPPCSKCGRSRASKEKQKSVNVDVLPSWTCPACRTVGSS